LFGGRKKRVEKLSAGAAEKLESGESIRELVQTQTGQSAMTNATKVMNTEFLTAETGLRYRAKTKAGPHVVVATERNLYAMKLSGARLLDVGEVVLKVPLDQADLNLEKSQLTFGGMTFHVMSLFGEHADRLYEYVSAAGSVNR
jgi:hypothetical protein